MSKTDENLKTAFAGESQARNKYTFFAQVARKEGFHYIAKLLEETAENERRHAKNESTLLHGIGGTITNLKEAIGGEHHETTEMYPTFVREAEAEGNKPAAGCSRRSRKSSSTTESGSRSFWRWLSRGWSINGSNRLSGSAAYAVVFTKEPNHRRNVPVAGILSSILSQLILTFEPIVKINQVRDQALFRHPLELRKRLWYLGSMSLGKLV
jgi:hypothetical protein